MATDDEAPRPELRVLRALAGHNQTDAARILGTDQRTYSRWETGESRLTPKELERTMRALAFAPRNVKRDAEAIGRYSAEELLLLTTQVKVAVDECLALWGQGSMSRAEAMGQIGPLLACQRSLLAALRARLAATPRPS
jgi:transcriptional regulator with XRE-family HTH domain